jgi:hypothetical protein
MSIVFARGNRTRSDKNPPHGPPKGSGPYMPPLLLGRQLAVSPHWHRSQWPQLIWNGTIPGSPTDALVTSLPMSMTSQTPS